MQIQQAEQQFPPGLSGFIALLRRATVCGPQVVSSGSRKPSSAPKAPDFGAFPGSLQELIGNRIHLNRILGLSNLYYIDPEDREIFEELRQVRAQLADLIVAAPEADLQAAWASDLGDRYWAMVRSGIQNEPLDLLMSSKRANQGPAPQQGGGLVLQEAPMQCLLPCLLNQVHAVGPTGAKFPSWLENYQQIFAQAVPQA